MDRLILVSGAQALAEIKRYANANRVSFSSHAYKRMRERGAVTGDVINALRTGTSARWQEQHQTWLVEGGVDCDGDDLEVACTVEDGVLVVTLY